MPSGKHVNVVVECASCGFQYQKRRTRIKPNRQNYCRSCATRKNTKVRFWTTEKLKEVIDLEGVTSIGTDYEKYLADIKEVYWERMDKLRDRGYEIEEQMNINIEDVLDVPF